MKVNISKLLDAASSLRSESGENPEYDRALVELIRDVTGLEYGILARRLDLQGESYRIQVGR